MNVRCFSQGLVFFAAVSGVQFACATVGEVSGYVKYIRSHDINVGTDWLQIEGVTSAGNCSKYGGMVVFSIRDDERGKRHFSAAVAAKMAGQKVLVGFDDVGLVSGTNCFIRYLDLI